MPEPHTQSQHLERNDTSGHTGTSVLRRVSPDIAADEFVTVMSPSRMRVTELGDRRLEHDSASSLSTPVAHAGESPAR